MGNELVVKYGRKTKVFKEEWNTYSIDDGILRVRDCDRNPIMTFANGKWDTIEVRSDGAVV